MKKNKPTKTTSDEFAIVESYAILTKGGITALVKPDYHNLNKAAGENSRLLHAVMCAYAKHHMGCEDIGWNQLCDVLHSAICNEIGDQAYMEWSNSLNVSCDL